MEGRVEGWMDERILRAKDEGELESLYVITFSPKILE